MLGPWLHPAILVAASEMRYQAGVDKLVVPPALAPASTSLGLLTSYPAENPQPGNTPFHRAIPDQWACHILPSHPFHYCASILCHPARTLLVSHRRLSLPVKKKQRLRIKEVILWRVLDQNPPINQSATVRSKKTSSALHAEISFATCSFRQTAGKGTEYAKRMQTITINFGLPCSKALLNSCEAIFAWATAPP